MPMMLKPRDAWTDYVRHVDAIPPLTASAERALARRILEGGDAARRARRKLVEAHLEFVIEVASQSARGRLALPDLVQEGNLALVEAAEQFDPLKGERFAHFAGARVRAAIMKALGPEDWKVS